MTTQVLINRFLNHLRRDGKSVLTLSAYATDLKQFSAAIYPTPITLLTNPKLTTNNQQLITRFSPNSRARKLTSIREFLRWCSQQGYTKQDLSSSIARPARISQEPVKPLSKNQILRLRRAADPLERLLLESLLQTGMKLPEVIILSMKHLDVKSAVLCHPLSPIRYPLSGRLHQAISYYLESKKQTVSKMVVTGPRGKRMSVRTASAILKKLSQKAGVLHATARNLRATFIVRQLEAGTPLSTIAHIVGHESLATTERYARFASVLSLREIVALADI